MNEQDPTPATELEAPIAGGEQVGDVTVIKPAGISESDKIAAQVGVDKAFKAIKAQKTVRIRVPKVMGPQVVIINGARFNVPANVFVDVPEQVAQILQDAGRI